MEIGDQPRSRGGFNSLWNYFPHTWIFSDCIGEFFFFKKGGMKCGLGRDSNPDPSALKPSECTTTPSTFSFMRKRKCSMENRKSFVYLLVTNTMTKKPAKGNFFIVNWSLLCSLGSTKLVNLTQVSADLDSCYNNYENLVSSSKLPNNELHAPKNCSCDCSDLLLIIITSISTAFLIVVIVIIVVNCILITCCQSNKTYE